MTKIEKYEKDIKEMISKMEKSNEERRKKYIEMVQELRWLGQEIMENDGNASEDFLEEIENMDMHLECCKNILKEANK